MKEFNCLENCPDLGTCCRNFNLRLAGTNQPVGFLKRKISAEKMTAKMRKLGYPFVAAKYDEIKNCWSFNCPMIAADGRCSIYENRPLVCRNCRPGLDCPIVTVKTSFREKIKKLFGG